MIKLLAALLLLPLSAAAESGAFPAFNFMGVKALRAEKPVAAVEPAARPADVVVKSHMYIQAGKEVLFGHADTPEQYAEAVAYWTEVLEAAGIQPGVPTYKDTFFTLPYKTADGRVIRAFVAEARQFPPKDETGLRANMALAQKSLAAAGLTPVTARVLNLEYILPTYAVLYLTKPEAKPEHETQLRVLKQGGDIEMDLVALSGVKVMQKPEPWLLVYVGAELGSVGLWAKTPADLALKLQARKDYLVKAGKKMIGEKFFPIDHDEYKFGVELMFFQ